MVVDDDTFRAVGFTGYGIKLGQQFFCLEYSVSCNCNSANDLLCPFADINLEVETLVLRIYLLPDFHLHIGISRLSIQEFQRANVRLEHKRIEDAF